MKIVKKNSTENCHFYSCEKSQHILRGHVNVILYGALKEIKKVSRIFWSTVKGSFISTELFR